MSSQHHDGRTDTYPGAAGDRQGSGARPPEPAPIPTRFRFTSSEIDAAKHDEHTWHEFIRRREAELIFSLFPDHQFDRALELGAGDGGQSMTIAKYCRKLVCTELEEVGEHAGRFRARDLPNVEYRLCDAQDLSIFADESFDLVFSSNMMEHVPDVPRCLAECRRVLRGDGVMIHLMPSRTWKVACFVLTTLRLLLPPVHGIRGGHLAEWYYFGAGPWVQRFEEAGLRLAGVIHMPFYGGVGNRFIPVIKLGNRLGLSASLAYIVRK